MTFSENTNMNPSPTPYIILRQTRMEKAFRSPDGSEFPHTIVDFEPIIAGKTREPHILLECNSPEEALSLAKAAYPRFLLSVQPALEFFQCHQKPKLSQPSPNSSGQRPGRLYPASNRAK